MGEMEGGGGGPPVLPSPAPLEGEGGRDEAIPTILRTMRSVAVVGASDKPGRPSHRVTFYLIRAGFEVYPVNPTIKELGGRPVYPDLVSIPEAIDIVDIFRKPESVLPIVEEAISIGAKAVWMQEGIVNEEAAARARTAGLAVVMDRCIMKEHRKLLGAAPARFLQPSPPPHLSGAGGRRGWELRNTGGAEDGNSAPRPKETNPPSPPEAPHRFSSHPPLRS